jgi:dTDP-4-amino-4,6-dideoxygalactose transaminase
LDLKAQYHSIKGEIDAAISNVLESSQFILGSYVAAFEEEFAHLCNTRYGIGVNSGTSALHLALLAAGVGPGDEVITTPSTFVATVAAIVYAGAKPVFVDIAPDSYTIDASKIEPAITERTRAIMPVHLYGQMADMDAILEIAKRRGLIVIEDAAQAHLAEYKGRKAGSMGDFGCFSFYPGKNLGACGEGGMVVTNNPDFAHTIRMLRDWGQEKKYCHVLKGYNYRMEGIQGAVLSVKLKYLEKWTEARRAHAAGYNELLSGAGVALPVEMQYSRHVYHIYAIRSHYRDGLQLALNNLQIQSGIHYPFPVHLLDAYADLGYREGDFPNAEQLAKEELSLPMCPELTDGQVREVAAAVHEYKKKSEKQHDD